MAQTLCPVVSAEDRLRLAAIIGDRNRPQKQVARARAVLLSADRPGVAAIARQAAIGRRMARHRHQELPRFLDTVEAAVPPGRPVHCILDGHGSHKHPKVTARLARHPRWAFHLTPASGSWLDAVETFLPALTRRRIRRGTFSSIVDLQAAINRYLAEHDANPKPFTWTATPVSIMETLNHVNGSVQ